MCARFDQDPVSGRTRWINSPDDPWPAGHRPIRSIFPGEGAAIVRIRPGTTKRESIVVQFGLVPHWTEDPKYYSKFHTYNARGETVATLPSFRDPFKRQRCIIPVDAFYEWAEDEAGKKVLYKFTRHEGLFPFAGLWDQNTKLGITSCTIITSAPNETVAKTGHDRTPVILRPDQFDAWLDPKLQDSRALQPFLTTYPGTDFKIEAQKKP